MKKLLFLLLLMGNAIAAPTIDKLTPSPSTFDVGDPVTYEIVVTLDDGLTSNVVINDAIPLGLTLNSTFDIFLITNTGPSGGNITNRFDGALPNPTITKGSGSGDDIIIDFGDIELNADSDTTDNTFVIRINTTADGSSTGSLASAATLTYGAGTQVTDSGNPTITVNAPSATVTFEFLADSGYAGWVVPGAKVNDDSNHFDFDWCDFDGDEYLDAFSTHHNRDYNGLFTNDQDGTFTGLDPVTLGIIDNGSVKASCKDINGDGKDDLFIRDQDLGNGIWLSNGALGTVSFDARIGGPSDNEFLMVDINGDGVFELCDEDNDPEYRCYNLTTGATVATMFDHTDAALWGTDHIGEGYIAVDWDLDTWPDIVHTPSATVFINPGASGSWTQLNLTYNPSNLCTDGTRGQGERGQSVFDYDNDGDWDITCSEVHTNNGNGNSGAGLGGWVGETNNWQIYEQTSTNVLTRATPSTMENMITRNNGQPATNWIWADFANDGYWDLYATSFDRSDSNEKSGYWPNVNGTLVNQLEFPAQFLGDLNNTDCDFDGRSKAQVGDYDKDGKLDIVRHWSDCTGRRHGALDIVRNTSTNIGNWIKVHLECQGNNSDCEQARVNVYIAGTTTRVAPMLPIISHFDHDYRDPLIGVGIATSVKVEVILPYDLGVHVFDSIPVNRAIEINFTNDVGTWDSVAITNPYTLQVTTHAISINCIIFKQL